jgi:hypothetical protein
MKKHLFILGSILTFGAFSAKAYTMATAQYGNIPSSVITDKRPVVRALQEAMRSSAGGVQAALSYAEANDSDYTALDVNEGSFAGLDDDTAVSVSNGDIIFTFDLSEVIPNSTITWTLTYTPRFDGSEIDGWDCVSTATAQGLGSNFIAPSSGEVDPITKGLGWPYAGCTVN